MRFDRSLIVAKKDLAEFRKNKYIMMSIVFMPLLISVMMPIIYVVPINSIGQERASDLQLTFDITMNYTDASMDNTTLFDAHLERINITNCVLQRCEVVNSTVTSSFLESSLVANSSLRDSLVERCILDNLTSDRDNVIRGSRYIGGDSRLEALKDMMLNILLILLIIIPVAIPTVTASYSFVGEKVNRSLEPLLATPATDLELLVGKSGSIFAVSMGATWLSFAVATVMVDVLIEPALGYSPLPNAYWVVGVVLLAPAMCLMSIFANVLISSRVNDVRVSQQIGGVVILPVIVFFLISLVGFLSTGILPMLAFSAIIVAADLGILWISLKVFRREEILVRWK
ncbi:MAG: ABC transporter permease subunit [Thermoplasmata archaeon]